jgi:glyceraldehyde 3-phosphate dehydrogenase
MARVAINGMGRIGRATFKIIQNMPSLELIAVNDLIPPDGLAYLLQYDTVYRKYRKDIENDGKYLKENGKRCMVLGKKDPSKLPWRDLKIDIVFECTGLFAKKQDLIKHIKAGAKRVILSAPTKSRDVVTVVHGVNKPEPLTKVLSCASCTTNCVTPVVEIVGRRIGVRKAVMTTIHAYTGTQKIVDGYSRKPRRGRAGAANFLPTSTGAAKATTKVLPAFANKFDGVAVRGPIPTGSLADIVFLTGRETTKEEVNEIFRQESVGKRYKDIVGVTNDPVVSSDIIQDPRASIIDLGMTKVIDGDLVKIMSWYDNEWGYANQMIREAERMIKEINVRKAS